VPESAEWYNAGFLILWGSIVPQTRTPDAHFYTEARYKGTKSVVISPDSSEAAKLGDMWLSPRAGTDSALAMAMGHVILKEFHIERQGSRIPRTTSASLLTCRSWSGWRSAATATLWGACYGPRTSKPPSQGSIGFRWGELGKWNIEPKNAADGSEVTLTLSLASGGRAVPVAFPYFGGQQNEHFPANPNDGVLIRNLRVRPTGTPGRFLHSTRRCNGAKNPLSSDLTFSLAWERL
jgi:nitrate reductase / nitrite oxidoreductase, alpha subunit